MVGVKDGPLFNYEQFKAQFRQAARAKGIDPEKGLTDAQHATSKPSSFQIALMNSALRKRNHNDVQATIFDSHMRRHPLLYATDEQRSIMRDPNWWKAFDADDWKPGADGSVVEHRAFAAIRRAVEAADQSATPPRKKVTLEEMGEALHEVLKENPMQVDMRANLSQKEVV
jgi:hypothetical protein